MFNQNNEISMIITFSTHATDCHHGCTILALKIKF